MSLLVMGVWQFSSLTHTPYTDEGHTVTINTRDYSVPTLGFNVYGVLSQATCVPGDTDGTGQLELSPPPCPFHSLPLRPPFVPSV